MISAGNDIVSIDAVDIPRTKQIKFYSRILSTSEQALYTQPEYAHIPFEQFVWLLWSVKESAFKYLQRLNSALIFSPTKFIVTQLSVPLGFAPKGFEAAETAQRGFGDDAFKAVLTYGEFTLYSRSLIYRELIVSVINAGDNFENTCWGVKAIATSHPANQSAEVRTFLAKCLQQNFSLDAEIIKNAESIPLILIEGVAIPVSLSHHGRFVGYSYQAELIPEK